MRRIWHWLKGHQWRVWETYCDGHTHYINGNHYTVTHILLQCTECGWVKSKDVLGAYTLKKKDTLNELIGLVYGWGRYVRGGDGWRAQFAYPKCFYLKQHQAELIEPLKAYHVPIYVEQPVLMYNPEEDGYEYRGEEADWNLRTIEESAAIEERDSSDDED